MLNLSFDELLTQKDSETKALLQSSSYADYLKGLKQLALSTYGDLHANFKIYSDSFLTFNNSAIHTALNQAKASKKYERFEEHYGYKKIDGKYSGDPITGSLEYYRNQKGVSVIDDADSTNLHVSIAPGKVLELVDGGKTLVIRFDSFVFDDDAWGAYYSGSHSACPNPDEVVGFPNDSVALFYKACYYIRRDKMADNGDYKNVNNILIDDSCNTGGDKIALQYILDLITGTGDLYYEDVHTSTRYHEIVKADLNLDGKINADDDEFRAYFTDLNIAILCSFRSFSCGNALPFFAKDRENSKIKIIGERSGGGSCIVGPGITADGFPFTYSVNSRLCSRDFSKTAEGGAEPDYELADYSKFFDSNELVTVLKTVFGDNY